MNAEDLALTGARPAAEAVLVLGRSLMAILAGALLGFAISSVTLLSSGL